ncbi:hypothetical protein LJC46_02090 [Desulfovibrio sp. OttesenSCG-928-G15]|nr:hypothetical protein [Desulfovibrio sp. OttesenSCG-928-G15]
MLKVPFKLTYGLEYEGKLYRVGEMRMPTLEDVECAIEELAVLMPESNPTQARVDRHTWARTITSLGNIPPEKITAELLASLPAADYSTLKEAENTLEKKQRELKCYSDPEDCELFG